jgi:4-phytase/acid phosphatase
MKIPTLLLAVLCALLASVTVPARAQTASSSDLRSVVVVMRHGVRSPTHPDELQPYARDKWPAWEVKPGYLTPHGAQLVKQLGTYYRRTYATLLGTSGCPAPGSVFVWADVDERTVKSGESLVQGLAPGCGIKVGHGAADPDTLFDPLPSIAKADPRVATAALLGAVGNDPAALNGAYGSQFATIDAILGCERSGCKTVASVPTTLESKNDDGLAGLNGGMDIAADVAENVLLEYTDAKPVVGWGRATKQQLLTALQVHVANKRLEKSGYAARTHSSNILSHVMELLRGERHASFLVGHDTQLAEFAAMLHLSWLVPGDAMNDTPPGSALIFELHGTDAAQYVRTYFLAQTLDDMRAGRGTNPQRVPVYVTGCPGFDCPLDTFTSVVNGAIDPKFVAPWNP